MQKRRVGYLGGDMGIGEDTEIRVRGSENGKKEVQGSGNVRGKDGVKLLLGESKEKSKGIGKVKGKYSIRIRILKCPQKRNEEFHAMKFGYYLRRT